MVRNFRYDKICGVVRASLLNFPLENRPGKTGPDWEVGFPCLLTGRRLIGCCCDWTALYWTNILTIIFGKAWSLRNMPAVGR